MTIFSNGQHEKRYSELLQRMQTADEYHRPLAYLLALDDICSAHAEEIFDFDGDAIRPDAISAEWQTGTSCKTMRLAFNLWNGFFYDDAESDSPSGLYAPENIFCTNHMIYFFEAIKLRFPIYAQPAKLDG